MGYACPVCDLPQADGEHLAHHLAITALTRGGDHEAWLDDHAEGWAEQSPADLASSVTEYADPAEYEEVFEDTTRHDHGSGFDERMARELGGDGAAGSGAGARRGGRPGADSAVDERTAEVLEEARELTERMYADEEADDDRSESETASTMASDEDARNGSGDEGESDDVATDSDE